MKEITIKLVYEDIKEIIEPEKKGLIIKFNNGDKLTFKNNEYSKKLRRHLKKNFSSEHLD